MMRRVTAATLALCLTLAGRALAQEPAEWHELAVPGGRATLRLLDIPDSRDRAAVMIDLIRRLHFSTTPRLSLEPALRRLPVSGVETLTVPLPMRHDTWERVVFGRSIPRTALFREILNDRSARLLFHGLAGVDGTTRQWFERQPELLRTIYRDRQAAQAFAIFAPAILTSAGRVDIPGGEAAAGRWVAALQMAADRPAQFISRLMTDRRSRTAGLYFLTAFVEQPRRQFLLSANRPGGQERFEQLVARFADCYPPQVNDYPFAVRSYDPALLLLETPLGRDGEPSGPRSRRFWQSVLDVDSLADPGQARDDGGDVDAAWIVDRLCGAPPADRPAIFDTWLTGHRVFAGMPEKDWAATVLALRVRRLFPAVFVAMERAGLRDPAVFVSIGRHALLLDRLTGDEASIALAQFQGAIALVLNARRALRTPDIEELLVSLARTEFTDHRYDGRVADWFEREWLPLLRRRLPLNATGSAEEVVVHALAGAASTAPEPIRWEGIEYVIDYPAMMRDRLRAVRTAQAGDTIDRALEMRRDARHRAARDVADRALAAALASWAYAPHLGAADSGALTGGDPSPRHDFGLRVVNRTRFSQRWQSAATAGQHGAVAGALLGMDAALAQWSLQRLSSDVIPLPPRLEDNDRASLMLSAALSDPARVDDRQMRLLSGTIARGTEVIANAQRDPPALHRLAVAAAISPWRRAVLDWMVSHEPGAIARQFSLVERARIGGLDISVVSGWGGAAVRSGCLCLRMPPPHIPELVLGRSADGIVGGQAVDLMMRVAMLLDDMTMPAALAPAIQSYAMRDFIDGVQPLHPADVEAYSQQAQLLTRTAMEDYLGAIAAVGPLRPHHR